MNYIVVAENNGRQNMHKVSLCNGSSIVVGRGWQCDVIVSDEYVDANHIRVSADPDGQLKLEDLGTKNGTQLNQTAIAAKTEYRSGSVITIGETTVSVHSADVEVPSALKHDAVYSVSRLLGNNTWVIVSSILACLAVLARSHWATSSEADHESLAYEFLGLGVLFSIWCLFASFIGKSFRNQTLGKLHWIFISLLFSFQIVVTLVTDVLRFNMDSNLAETILTNGVAVLPLGLLVYGTLTLCTRMPSAKKLLSVFSLMCLMLIYQNITPMLANEHELWSDMPSVTRVNQPPALLFNTPTTLDNHIEKTKSIFSKLDNKVHLASKNPPR